MSSGEVLGIQIAFDSPDPYNRGELYTIYLQGGITDWQTFASAQLSNQVPVGGVDAAFVISVASVPVPSLVLDFPAFCSLAAVYLRGGAGTGRSLLLSQPDQNT